MRGTAFLLGVTLILAGGGCGDDQRGELVPSMPPAQPLASEVVLRDRSVTDTAEAVARAISQPIAIDASAQPIASCARVTVIAPGRPTQLAVLQTFEDALGSTGLRLDRADGRLTVRRHPTVLPPAACAAASGPPPMVPAPAPLAPAELANQVHADSETEYRIVRELRDRLLVDQTSLVTGARVIPRVENGVVIGIGVYGIRSTSWAHAVGIRNGDTIRAVNGQALTDPQRALDAYTHGRDANEYTIDITRRGQPMQLHWRIVDHL